MNSFFKRLADFFTLQRVGPVPPQAGVRVRNRRAHSGNPAANRRRRNLLFLGLGVGTAALLPVCGGQGSSTPSDGGDLSTFPVESGAENAIASVPATEISLADYGGVPGASPATLKNAFVQAFSRLKASGGGTLNVGPGIYDFGETNDAATAMISMEELSNVVIAAKGATFRLKTTANVISMMFYFTNPNNVTLSGAHFNDTGYVASVNWHGMYGVRIDSNRACNGFNLVNCSAESAIGLFACELVESQKFMMRGISLHGNVKNVYYGATLTYIGDNAKVALVCEDVRRAVICHGLKNADINLKVRSNAGSLGSNGLVALICEGESQGNVENLRIKLDVSGIGNHGGLVHFYHQKDEVQGYMRNIDAEVTVNGLQRTNVTTNMFIFDHQIAMLVMPATGRSWEQIFLRGSVTGNLTGNVITNPSVSTSSGPIYVDTSLASRVRISSLPNYFRIR